MRAIQLSRPGKPPSQTWRAFLKNHLAETAAIDFFTVPTATFRVQFVFVVLGQERRRVVHFGVTERPTQEWTSQQLREAFPWDQAPRYVLRDRDAIYGRDFAAMTRDMGIEEVLNAPRSPGKIPLWNGWWAPSDASAWITLWCGMRDRCVERFTTILPTITDREPISRWERTRPSHDPQPPGMGSLVALPQVGGLHHRYQRRAA